LARIQATKKAGAIQVIDESPLAAARDGASSVASLKKVIRKTIKSNDAEADTLCHILSYVGIIATEENPGFFADFVPFDQRDDSKPVGDERYPLNCWQGNAYNNDAANFWFPDAIAT